ncbi:alpha/beta fold hydrolase [Actinomadura sp. 6K520]|uniref:alpha/beta hydrolase n=1 Tax=Actinomadura sp. 6K520 TaxID=2530364 RepID=UPI0010478839|nr:alpha/beta fold hydrolase [Actinomadura sp. 6K520]TDE32658.1 alpha/beta fold hydrolase [Actinomadura sp. 6K520]
MEIVVMPESLTLYTADGVRIDAGHLRGGGDLCFVLAHGFTCSWRQPALRRIAGVLNRRGGVIGLDFRGHGRSGGHSTVGDREVLDIDAVVAAARRRGYERIVVTGFSMGGAIGIRHAALHGGIDAVVSVSAPARWYYRDTVPMRRVHWAIERRAGRLAVRLARGTRIARNGWDPVPEAPREVVGRIAPVPLLIVHGDADAFFPLEHGRQLYDAAHDPRELWIEPAFGHAEVAATPHLIKRIGDWAAVAAGR